MRTNNVYLATCMRKAHQHAVFTFRVEAEDLCEAAIKANKKLEKVCIYSEVRCVMVERLTVDGKPV